MFTAFCFERRPIDEIAREHQLSPEQVGRIVDEVSAQLGRVRRNGSAPIGPESALEDLSLSARTRNALRAMGCHTVDDVLRLDLSQPVRGLGVRSRQELLERLGRAGIRHPGLEEQPASEIRVLERSLERIQRRMERAFGAVAKEIRLVKQRLRKRSALPPRDDDDQMR